MTINQSADALLELLTDAATAPNTVSPYLRQADLMEALGIVSRHTMSQIVTRASQRVPKGYAILQSIDFGYRLADKATARELRSERRRLRTARTMIERVATALSAERNGPLSHMVGRQLSAVITTMIDPILDSLDLIIGEAN